MDLATGAGDIEESKQDKRQEAIRTGVAVGFLAFMFICLFLCWLRMRGYRAFGECCCCTGACCGFEVVDEDIESGEMRSDLTAIRRRYQEATARRRGGRCREETGCGGCLEERQRGVARELGAALECDHRNGDLCPPDYEEATRIPHVQDGGSGGGPQQDPPLPRREMLLEPPNYGQAIGIGPTPEISCPPPTYDPSDPHPRSQRRFIPFQKLNEDMQQLRRLRDASEDADERLGFNLGVQRIKSLHTYAQGWPEVPAPQESGLAQRPGVYVDAHVLDPVVRLADGLLRPRESLLRQLEAVESPWLLKQFQQGHVYT